MVHQRSRECLPSLAPGGKKARGIRPAAGGTPVDSDVPLRLDWIVRFCIFSSGSRQNCFYLESDEAAVLIDMGISFRCLRGMLEGLGRRPDQLSAVLVSHEHIDHTRGLPMLLKQASLPLHVHPASHRCLQLPADNLFELYAHTPLTIGDLTILPFPVQHDAVNTFGFKVIHHGRSLFLASDLGSFDETLIALSASCDAIGIEANYDVQILQQCGYPPHLKRRIRSDRGHLSNDDAMRFLHQAIGSSTRAVFMLHLSANSNSREQVQRHLDERLIAAYPGVAFYISYRDRALPLVEI